jgi:hypothetical protein
MVGTPSHSFDISAGSGAASGLPGGAGLYTDGITTGTDCLVTLPE